MADSFRRDVPPSQANPDDQPDRLRSISIDLAEMRTWINRAIRESGWNQTALAESMGKDEAYVSRVLSGEKPLSASFIRELPNDVERIVARYHAESFGLVVAEPLTGPAAIEAIVGAVVGLLTAAPALPAKASAMVRAELPAKARRQA